MYIDTHCHLDNKVYYNDYQNIISNAKTLGVEKIIIPGADINDLENAIKLSETYNDIYFALGIHPLETSSYNDVTKNIFIQTIAHKKCVAVGEIGLDYHNLPSCNQKEMQKKVFREQINIAITYNKPIIIHTRDSNDDIVEILKEFQNQIKALVFHCYGGDLNLINALKCKCYYGLGGVASFKNAQNLRDAIKKLPIDSIVLETDAPYLAPAPFRGKRNTPEYIPLINAIIAEIIGVDERELSKITSKNANKLFNLKNN